MKILTMRFASTGVLPHRNTHLTALSAVSHINLYNNFLSPHVQPIVISYQMTRTNHADHHYVNQMLATYTTNRTPLLVTVSGAILELHKPHRCLYVQLELFTETPRILPRHVLFLPHVLPRIFCQ